MTRADVDAIGALALVGAEVPRSADLRLRLLASAVRPGWGPWTDRVAALWDLSPLQVGRIFGEARAAPRWHPTPFPRVTSFDLEGGPATVGSDVGLVRIPDGLVFPSHTHEGIEEYVVLEGAMHFADGHREGPGDRVRHDASITHGYVAEGDVVVAIVMRGDIIPLG